MERDTKGRFAKGWKGGPGRPRRSTEDKYLRWMSARVKKADWQAIVDTATSRARAGDSRARQWLSDYLIGKPAQAIDVTSGGERLPSVIVYLPEIDGLETE